MTQPDPQQAARPAAGTLRFAERLTAPWWAWLGLPGLGALAAAEVHLGRQGGAAWLPYLVLIPAALIALIRLGRIRVAVTDDELLVDDARLPVRYVTEVTVLDAAARRDLLGPYAAPHAFVVQRPWVPTAVQVHLADPADPTPYWVVSSRRPVDLTAAVLAARE